MGFWNKELQYDFKNYISDSFKLAGANAEFIMNLIQELFDHQTQHQG
jgi:hypothetical protein